MGQFMIHWSKIIILTKPAYNYVTPKGFYRNERLELQHTRASYTHIYYSFDTGEYHESIGLVFTRVSQARE